MEKFFFADEKHFMNFLFNENSFNGKYSSHYRNAFVNYMGVSFCTHEEEFIGASSYNIYEVNNLPETYPAILALKKDIQVYGDFDGDWPHENDYEVTFEHTWIYEKDFQCNQVNDNNLIKEILNIVERFRFNHITANEAKTLLLNKLYNMKPDTFYDLINGMTPQQEKYYNQIVCMCFKIFY